MLEPTDNWRRSSCFSTRRHLDLLLLAPFHLDFGRPLGSPGKNHARAGRSLTLARHHHLGHLLANHRKTRPGTRGEHPEDKAPSHASPSLREDTRRFLKVAAKEGLDDVPSSEGAIMRLPSSSSSSSCALKGLHFPLDITGPVLRSLSVLSESMQH